MDNGVQLDDDDQMRSLVGLAVGVTFLAWTGCTKPNPRSCADGLCTDPAFPFCDTDGALQGEPEACIAVSCTPSDFVACRNDRAVTCNQAGNDYDVTECPRGCDVVAAGCKSCADSTHCSNPSPVCDSSSFECRVCRIDDECESLVCDVDTGRCLATSEVIYASPAGINTGACSRDVPCSASRAVAVAAATQIKSVVRLLPGDYLDNVRVSTGTIVIVGSGARIDAQNPGGVFTVLRGANVTIRGLLIDLSHGPLFCGGGAVTTDPGGTLTLRDLTVESRSNYIVDMLDCTAIARRVKFTGGGRSFILRDRSSFDGDRVHFHTGNYPLLMGMDTSLTIKNSVFDNVIMVLDPQDTGGTTSRVLFAFNTFYASSSSIAFYRQPTTNALSATVENNVVVSASPNATSAITCPAPDCIVRHNVVFPQATALPATNIVMDPKMVNPAMGDYRLRADSPARDIAMPSGLGATDHDFSGVARPQGSAPDVGAFELVP